MKNISEITVGDKVRSFDFPGNKATVGDHACFVEGTVEAITTQLDGCPRYKIRVERRVFGGKTIAPGADGAHVYPPVNGLEGFSGKTDGVDRIDGEGE